MKATTSPARGRRVALALALALLAAMVVPSLLAASEERLAGADEAADEASTQAEAGDGDGSQEAEAPFDETDPAGPGAPGSIPPPPGGDLDRGEMVGEGADHDVPASEPNADERTAESTDNRRASRERGSPREARAAGAGAVDIRGNAYSPREITVQVGDAVRWTNGDRAPHDAEAFDGSFKTLVLERGESDSVTFSNAGTFRYFCSIHPPSQFPNFTGTVRVVAAEGAGGADPAGSDAGGAAVAGGGGQADEQAGVGEGASARRGSGLPATGLGLVPLSGLGLAFLGTGALLRRLTG